MMISLIVHFSKDDNIAITNVIPDSHWDETSQLFFAPLREQELILGRVMLSHFGHFYSQSCCLYRLP
jgi:hypothetical protein